MALLLNYINKQELLKVAHFFVVLHKIILNVLNVRLALFCLHASNCTHFQKSCTQKILSAGFTLIEILVVLGIVSILLSSTLFFNFDSYRRDAFRAEGKILESLLQTARADAMNNINQKPHGVALHPDGYNGYVTFEGEDYAHAEVHTLVQISESYHITFSLDSPHEIVFSQLSGDANFQGEVELIDDTRQASTSILINYEGNISY